MDSRFSVSIMMILRMNLKSIQCQNKRFLTFKWTFKITMPVFFSEFQNLANKLFQIRFICYFLWNVLHFYLFQKNSLSKSDWRHFSSIACSCDVHCLQRLESENILHSILQYFIGARQLSIWPFTLNIDLCYHSPLF